MLFKHISACDGLLHTMTVWCYWVLRMFIWSAFSYFPRSIRAEEGCEGQTQIILNWMHSYIVCMMIFRAVAPRPWQLTKQWSRSKKTVIPLIFSFELEKKLHNRLCTCCKWTLPHFRGPKIIKWKHLLLFQVRLHAVRFIMRLLN